MRWFGRLSMALVVLLLAYLAWPMLGLKRFADAIETRNTAEFSALLDVPELKRSLASQIVRAHLKLTGKDQRLTPLARNLAIQAGMVIADSFVVEIVNTGALIGLLKQARTETFAGPTQVPQGLGLPNLRHAAKLLGSEYRGRNFYVSLPLSAHPKDSYRLRLRLSQWTWRLAGIELPEEVQIRLARELLKRVAF